MMITPRTEDLIHKIWLYKLLGAMFNNVLISNNLYFKGGTCASMLGWLDRFSVDLDFDYIGDQKDIPEIRRILEGIFSDLKLIIDDSSKNTLQYFLKYDNGEHQRNTISIDSYFPVPKSNKYEAKRFADIDRTIMCQMVETMFAHKLVAITDRFDKRGTIAGRDIYDIHHFFSKSFDFDKNIIEEETSMKIKDYLTKLIKFIDEKVTETIIDQDLNFLLTPEEFKKVRKSLKGETLLYLRTYLGGL
jgi:predicted nucleotidyltransferase component of viral defense system